MRPDRAAGENTAALVVGGTSGIGFAVARLLRARGRAVRVASRDPDKVARAVERLRAERPADGGASGEPAVDGLTLDTTDVTSVQTAFATIPDGSLDGLVVTASRAVHGAFADADVDDVRAMVDSKLLGPYRVAQAALPKLADGGAIVLTSGVLSRRPGSNGAGLAAVNAAVEGLARALARELAPRLRVNAISPGMTDTEVYAGMTEAARASMFESVADSLPIGRVASPDEIAAGIAFLLDNGFTTGHVLDVDGGHLIG